MGKGGVSKGEPAGKGKGKAPAEPATPGVPEGCTPVPEGLRNNLPFLALGRVKDNVLLGVYCTCTSAEQATKTKDIFSKLLGAAKAKLKAGQRMRLQWNDGSVCVEMDQKSETLYCLVTSDLKYPERLAYSLLTEFQATLATKGDFSGIAANSLSPFMQTAIPPLVAKYDDPDGEALRAASGRASIIKSTPAGAEQLTLEQHRFADTRTLAESARELQAIQRRKNMRFLLCLMLIVVLVGTYVGYAFWQHDPTQHHHLQPGGEPAAVRVTESGAAEPTPSSQGLDAAVASSQVLIA